MEVQERESNIGKSAHGALQGLHEPSLAESAPFPMNRNTNTFRIFTTETPFMH